MPEVIVLALELVELPGVVHRGALRWPGAFFLSRREVLEPTASSRRDPLPSSETRGQIGDLSLVEEVHAGVASGWIEFSAFFEAPHRREAFSDPLSDLGPGQRHPQSLREHLSLRNCGASSSLPHARTNVRGGAGRIPSASQRAGKEDGTPRPCACDQGCLSFAPGMPTRKDDEMLTIKAAADVLRVSEVTLRRWDKAGKLCAKRHPMNGYRLYPRRQVLELRRQILSGVRKAS